MSKHEISEIIFKEKLPSVESILEKYPPRKLAEGAMVTRFAPSPTGFLHIGGVFTALISERLAHQTRGIYYVRIEDTDRKRRVEGAEEIIEEGLEYFGLAPDEGWGSKSQDEKLKMDYGPYKQSERELIYKAFLKKMVEEGTAYPCFMTAEELEEMRLKQAELKLRPGCYGEWAKWRAADEMVVKKKLEEGRPFVLRFKSPGDPNKKTVFDDLVKGRIEMQENDIDAVIMKSDGLPTYHFAHVIDDFLMRTTHVIRADEWLPSTPLHLQMCEVLGIKRMKYGHLSPITKMDKGNKRKISKRKDPEANVEYYQEKGYTTEAVIEYLMNLASSGFEDWRKNSKNKCYRDYKITFRALSNVSSPLFDEIKLKDIAKEVVARMTTEEVYAEVSLWAKKFDQEFYKKLTKDQDYWMRVFGIERQDGRRKDVSCWSEIYEQNEYFDLEKFAGADFEKFETLLTKEEVEKVRTRVAEKLKKLKTQEEFMSYMRELAKEFGLAENIKELKESKGRMRGHVGLVVQVVRYAVTGRTNSPDLFQIIEVLGAEEVRKRLKRL